MTNREKIEKFIKDNTIQFTRGQRGTNTIIICGYALSLEMTKFALWGVIGRLGDMGEDDSESEFERIYEYADRNKYSEYWNTPEAQENYIFDEVLSSQE